MLLASAAVFAQAPPPLDPPARLEALVARIALYPDPLLAQVLAAATFHEQIPDAARWADEHHDLAGQALALQMQARRLPWDPGVQAMLPFPAVLDAMASDREWTSRLGDAFLAHQAEVLDAVQRLRVTARDSGILRGNEQIAVSSGPYIAILPVKPAHIAVPSYDSGAVFAAVPRSGAARTGAVRWSDPVLVGGFQPYGWNLEKFAVIGGYFQAWGWGLAFIDWGARSVIINDSPWRRNWANRNEYVHPYPALQRVAPPQ